MAARPSTTFATSLLLALPLAVARLAAACEVSEDSSRIAVAGGSLTEIVYFLGAQERIVAVDSTSTYPAAASAFPSVGYVRALSAEGLLSLAPTLVLGEDDMGPPEALSQVERTGVDIVRIPEAHTAAGILAKIRCVASVLDLAGQAEALIDAGIAPAMTALDDLAAESAADRPRVALLLEIRDGMPIGAGRNTSGDGILRMAGAENTLAGFTGWKPVSPEAMLSAEPEYILISERSVRSAGGAERVLSHPALRSIALGLEDGAAQRLIVMDGMAMLGFGPRTLEAALQLALELHPQEPDERAIHE